MELTPYPAYKPSGLPWLGEIPQDWEVKKLKYVAKTVQTGGTPPSDKTEYYNGDINWFTPADFGEHLMLTNSKRKLSEKAVQDKVIRVFERYSVLLVGIGATLGRVGIATNLCSSNQQINAITFLSTYNSFFGAYFLKSHTEIITSFANTATLAILNQSQTKDLYVIVPPLAEQMAIAAYLDTQTAHLDQLIARKRRMIELLRDERAGLINDAVTKGLDPNVPRRDSGLPWLGEIPAHWRVKKLKYVVNEMIDTEHKTVPFKEDGKYYVVRTSDVRNGVLLIDKMRRTDEEGYLEWTRRAIPEAGDIFFTREAPAGEACVVPENLPVCLGQRMVLFRTDRSKALSQFIVHLIYSKVVGEYVQQLSQGSTVSHFNMADIRNIPLLLPELVEQAEIIAYIEAETVQIDRTIGKIEQEMALLNEYRSALISEVVTGKIKVS